MQEGSGQCQLGLAHAAITPTPIVNILWGAKGEENEGIETRDFPTPEHPGSVSVVSSQYSKVLGGAPERQSATFRSSVSSLSLEKKRSAV
jgi:hypothetical protein